MKKLAICDRKGSFSEGWVEYCQENGISYCLLNPYDTDIVEKAKGCDAFLWHFHHAKAEDALMARPLLYALQEAGIKVFPDFRTAWHFDDKVGQKYLLEAIKAPLVKSYVFYSRKNAEQWATATTYPKVFKLRGGAGASNVKIVRSQKEALSYIKKSFTTGFKQYRRLETIKERYGCWTRGTLPFKSVLAAFRDICTIPTFAKVKGPERGYVYFQDFIAGNDSDVRVIVIGGKAIAIKRMCRENDFRASGSGLIYYEKECINEDCVKVAFDVSTKLQAQSVAFDFVFDDMGKPLIVEISYGFAANAYGKCPGYWTQDMQWHKAEVCPQKWMIEDLIKNEKNINCC